MAKATVKVYASPGCVLLTFDWADGENHPDFLGFAIERNPGYSKNGAAEFLFNKLDFVPPKDQAAKPKTSDKAPFQKFNWWDGGINPADLGKVFQYTIIPVIGTGPDDLKLQHNAAAVAKVTIPQVEENNISTYFNRAVVSAQSFLKLKTAALDKQMTWLANGLQNAVPDVLQESDAFDCAIYHLSDELWILPAFQAFAGRGAITYFDKGKDTKSAAAIDVLQESNNNISSHKRDKIRSLMHDKFIVSYQDGKEAAVLMGSTNFTPEAQTVQANLLHIIKSPRLAELYAQRAHRLSANPTTKDIAASAGWQDVSDVTGSKIRVFFLPEPGTDRDFLNTVSEAVKHAKSSVLFCMFTASDEELMDAIFAQGDSKDHLIYGLLNAIDDPDRPTKKGDKRKLPPIATTIYHRSHEKPDTLPYSAFGIDAPKGWLPELRTIDTSPYDVSIKPSKASKKTKTPPPIHVHHKFIVIDGDTETPIIYTGSPNFSKNSENANDENVLEIKGNVALAHIYVAEFLRLYNHYRARAIWARTHDGTGKSAKASSDETDILVLKKTRDEWVKGAFHKGTKEFLSRTRGL